jgi:hypothetical protein
MQACSASERRLSCGRPVASKADALRSTTLFGAAKSGVPRACSLDHHSVITEWSVSGINPNLADVASRRTRFRDFSPRPAASTKVVFRARCPDCANPTSAGFGKFYTYTAA